MILSGCTVVFNVALNSFGGAGVDQGRDTALTIDGCILWGNNANGSLYQGAQIDVDDDDDVAISYSNIQNWRGNLGGVANFGRDPMFLDPQGPDGLSGTDDDDLRLLAGSPCINTGDPAFVAAPGETDLDGNARLQGCRVDLGAYETDTGQLPGDFDNDDDVDLEDLAAFQNCFRAGTGETQWLDECMCAFDFEEDSLVDLNDYPDFWTEFTTR